MSAFLRSARAVSRNVSATRAVARSTSASLNGARWVAASLPRTFSTSRSAWSAGQNDLALSSKLGEELKFEQENVAEDAFSPAFLQQFKEEGLWTIEETAGHDEVALVREFGNEKIRLLFSIADIDTPAEAETEEGEEATPEEGSFPIRTSITVTKSNQGALSIDAIVQDGTFIVDNISFYDNAKLATDNTAEADWNRRGLYIGPQFDHLDVAVQEHFESFLDERGINSNLALFIPAFAEYKEQREYIKWLGKVKSFVEQ